MKISRFLLIISLILAFLSHPAASHAAAKQNSGSTNNPSKFQTTVSFPIQNGINLTISPELKNQPIAHLGFVDITAPPFLADMTGKKDSTKAIQNAINFARDHQMICLFPSGKYLISDTLSCVQQPYLKINGKIGTGRLFPCVLIGSRQGPRPEIILSPNSPGFMNPLKPKYMIHFWAGGKKKLGKPQPNISFNQALININLTIGSGNSGAVAIRHRGAQGSAIQQCAINAKNGLTGIEGGCGSGGSFTDITILGGVVGMDLRETQPAPTITGVTLINQKKNAILYSGRQALTAVGINIITYTQGPVIKAQSVNWTPFHGQISLIDSKIDFRNADGIALSSESSIFMQNVYIKGAKAIVSNKSGYTIPGTPDSWVHIKEYAHGVSPKKWKGYQFKMPIYVDGNVSTRDLLVQTTILKPPETIQTKHLWKDNFPDWESPKAVNVKLPPYNAQGDGNHDDTKAIQEAINKNEIVFFPKGYYNLSKTILLKPETKIIGVGRHLSTFITRENTISSGNKPFPLIQTANTKSAETIIAFCGFYIPRGIVNAYMLNWQCGGDSILRAVNFWTKPPKKNFYKPIQLNHPLVLITGNGGGKWYNFFQEDYSKHHGQKYRHLLIKDGVGPLNFYQCNPEHANSESNMEINNYKNVSIYGLKGESTSPIITIKNSDFISIYGYGGNAFALKNDALIKIKNTPNFLFANLVDTPSVRKKKSRPDQWHMLIETYQNKTIRTLPLERPVLYKRGN